MKTLPVMSAYKCHHSHHAQVQSQKFCTLGFRQQEYCEQPNHDERPESYNIKKCNNNYYYHYYYHCRRQEEPAVLISYLLLRMRPMYVASIRLDIVIRGDWL